MFLTWMLFQTCCISSVGETEPNIISLFGHLQQFSIFLFYYEVSVNLE